MVAGSGTPLTQDELKAAAQRAFPDYQVDQVWKNKNPNQAIEVWMERNGKHKQRILDPYTGADLGPSEPAGVRLILWLADLHDNLLYRETGRFINGFGAVFLTLLCLTGAVIWWPGIASWRHCQASTWFGRIHLRPWWTISSLTMSFKEMPVPVTRYCAGSRAFTSADLRAGR